MLTDLLAVAGLVAVLLLWLAIQRLGGRGERAAIEGFRCGACGGDCGGGRADCPWAGMRGAAAPADDSAEVSKGTK